MRAVMQQTPVSMQSPYAKSSMAYEEIANMLMDNDENKTKPKRGMAAFFSHIIAGKKLN